MPTLNNPRQERFCLKYFTTGNATQSAIKAGYSPKTAAPIGSRMLRFVNNSDHWRELETETTSSKIMEIRDRKERLSEVARQGNIKQTNPVEAIRLNPIAAGAYGIRAESYHTENGCGSRRRFQQGSRIWI